MPKKSKKTQLELFNRKPAISIEDRLNELEEKIKMAIDSGDLKKAEGLIEEQRTLLENLMSSNDKL